MRRYREKDKEREKERETNTMHVSVYTMWKKQGKKEPESLLGHIIHNENIQDTRTNTHTYSRRNTHTKIIRISNCMDSSKSYKRSLKQT